MSEVAPDIPNTSEISPAEYKKNGATAVSAFLQEEAQAAKLAILAVEQKRLERAASKGVGAPPFFRTANGMSYRLHDQDNIAIAELPDRRTPGAEDWKMWVNGHIEVNSRGVAKGLQALLQNDGRELIEPENHVLNVDEVTLLGRLPGITQEVGQEILRVQKGVRGMQQLAKSLPRET